MSWKPAGCGREEEKEGGVVWVAMHCADALHWPGTGEESLPAVRPLTQQDCAVRGGLGRHRQPLPWEALGWCWREEDGWPHSEDPARARAPLLLSCLSITCGGVQLGPITASSIWPLCSATLEPWWSPRHVGFSDAPEAMMLCPWALIKPEGFFDRAQMSFLSKSASVG